MLIKCESFLLVFIFLLSSYRNSSGKLKQGATINLNYYLTQYETGNIVGLSINIWISLQLLTSSY